MHMYPRGVCLGSEPVHDCTSDVYTRRKGYIPGFDDMTIGTRKLNEGWRGNLCPTD